MANPIEKVVRKIDHFQQSHTPFAFMFAIVKKFGDDQAGALVSNLAYSGLISIFPLLLLLVTILNIVAAKNPHFAQLVLNSALAQIPIVGSSLGHNIHALHKGSIIGIVVGVIGLIWGSIGLAQAGVFAMEQVWNLPATLRPNYIKRLLRSVLFLLALLLGVIGTSFLASFATFASHSLVVALVGDIFSVLLNIAIYILIFRILTPKVVALAQLVPGGVVGGIGWTLMQALGGYLIAHDLKSSAIYGTFAIVLGLIAWIYLGSEIAIYSAEINVVLAEHLWPRSIVQPPLTSADKASITFQATQNQRRPEQHVQVWFDKDEKSEKESSTSEPHASSTQ